MKINTNKLNLSAILGILTVIILTIIFLYWNKNTTSSITSTEIRTENTRTTSTPDPRFKPYEPDNEPEESLEIQIPGYFKDYDSSYIEEINQKDRIIIFFSSSNCASCLRVENSIINGQQNIPSDLHILKADFNRNFELRELYNVKIPHTFVQITTDMSLIQKWTHSPTLTSILSRL